jgi:hypothetical protein
MDKNEAVALAEKRNKHKSPSLKDKAWQAVEQDGEWKVILVETKEAKIAKAKKLEQEALADAREAFFGGGTIGDFNDAASRMFSARMEMIRQSFDTEEGN